MVFVSGATVATVQFPIVDDLVVEESEEFGATLSTDDPIVVFGNRIGSITILDNDGRIIIVALLLLLIVALQFQSQCLSRQCTQFLRTIVQFLCVLMLVWNYKDQQNIPSLQKAKTHQMLKVSGPLFAKIPVFRVVKFIFLSFLISCTEADYFPSTTVTVTPPSSVACIDFTNIVVDDNIALEGDQSFNICVGDSTSMVVIIDDDGEWIELKIYIFYF